MSVMYCTSLLCAFFFFECTIPSIQSTASACRCIYTLYLLSDSYLGVDQQYDLHFNVMPASMPAQVNSEVSDPAVGPP